MIVAEIIANAQKHCKSAEEWSNKNMQKGQVLLLTTLILSAMIISAYSFVGYLAIKKLHQSILTVDSAQAFYASDSGIEYELYQSNINGSEPRYAPCPFSNDNIGFRTDISFNGDSATDNNLGLVIKSTGQTYKVTRSQKDFSQTVGNNPSNPRQPISNTCPSGLRNIYNL